MRTTKTRPTRNVSSPKMAKHNISNQRKSDSQPFSPMNEKDLFLAHSRHSNDDLQAAEDFFYLAMISSKNYNPQYTFPLEDSMLTKNLTKKSFVICQLIGGYTERDVVRICSHVKAEPFNLIVEKIKKVIF